MSWSADRSLARLTPFSPLRSVQRYTDSSSALGNDSMNGIATGAPFTMRFDGTGVLSPPAEIAPM